MKNWKIVKLGDVLNNRQIQPDAVEIAEGKTSIIAKISFSDGRIELRNDGKNNTKLICCFPNDLILSGINVSKGAIAINTFNKIIAATIHYSSYYHDSKKVDLHFLLYYFRSKNFQNSLNFEMSQGLKTEVKPKKFLSIEAALPSLPEQQRIVNRLESVKSKIEAVKILRGEQNRLNKSLLFSLFTDLVKGAKWQKMGEVAPLAKRPVSLQPNTKYNEIGARSFGKGTFDKPIVNSDELTWQKPNWIKTGDLLFSNIKAWEGAIAAVTEKDNDKIGSHRYLTFVPDSEVTTAEFLCFYFLTYEGLEKLGNASPGSADRNRTLNTKIISNTLVPVPSLHLQKEFLEIKAKLNTTTQHQVTQQQALETLLPSALDKAFKGEW